MTHKTRLAQLEKIHAPNIPPAIFIYYYDIEHGYSKKSDGPYFATLDELIAAQGRTIGASDTLLRVVRESQTQVFIPDNQRHVT